MSNEKEKETKLDTEIPEGFSNGAPTLREEVEAAMLRCGHTSDAVFVLVVHDNEQLKVYADTEIASAIEMLSVAARSMARDFIRPATNSAH